MDESDERLKSPVSEGITIQIPVGAGRSLYFLSNEQSGKVMVSYEGKTKTYDLYKKEAGVKPVSVPDSNAFYDNAIKLIRLAGYSLMILCMTGLVFFLTQKLERKLLLKGLYLILSVLTTLTFFLNMGITTRSGTGIVHLIVDFNYSINAGNFLLSVIIIPLLYVFYQRCGENFQKKYCSIRGTLCLMAPSGVFALFMVIGSAFTIDNTLRSIFENELQLLKAFVTFTGYFALFFFGITQLYAWLDQVDLYKVSFRKHIKPIQWYLNTLSKRPFLTSFLTLLIAYIPYMIVSYPAVIMGDCPHQFGIAYGIYELNNAHPIAHTLLMKLCLRLGSIFFESTNIGIFIYATIQLLFVISCVSFVNKILVSRNITSKVPICIIIYYICHPRIQNYMFAVTKDVINSLFLLIFIVFLYVILTGAKTAAVYISLGLSAIGAVLFRHDSIYIIAITLFIILFIAKNFRKQSMAFLIFIICFALSWKTFLSAMDIPPNKPWSNPNAGILAGMMAQQTARYLRDAEAEVTEEERNAISAFFDAEALPQKYTPDDKIDGAFSTIKRNASKEDWGKYQSVWINMFFKHPEIYIEAILNLKYDHLYPLKFNMASYKWSNNWMENTNINTIKNMPSALSHPDAVLGLREKYESLRESFSQVPILNIPFITSSYWWILFIWFSYCIYRKKRVSIAIMMPLLILVLVLIAGPTNARYFRYLYPYALCLPVVITLGLTIERENLPVSNIA